MISSAGNNTQSNARTGAAPLSPRDSTEIRGNAQTERKAKQATIDYNSFLKLMVAQMKNQDPTSPVKSSEYMGQLASFSAVEQGVNTNRKLDAVLTSLSITQASHLVGKTVKSADGRTQGIVQSVEIYSNGARAKIGGNRYIDLGSGIEILNQVAANRTNTAAMTAAPTRQASAAQATPAAPAGQPSPAQPSTGQASAAQPSTGQASAAQPASNQTGA